MWRLRVGRGGSEEQVVGAHLNGQGERLRAGTPSPSLLIPVANIPSYLGRASNTA
jgi:hypothetical protein